MSKPKLIVVHGMGQHTEASFKKEIVDGLAWAFKLYTKDDGSGRFVGKSPEHYVDVIPVAYNDIFDNYRQKSADRNQPVRDRLKAIPNMKGSILTKAVKELTNAQSALNDDDFFKTHFLDVFFYRYTNLGELARIRVGKVISDTIGTVKGGIHRVHVLGHSLGTAVLHDSLAFLYTNDDFIKVGANKLSTSTHKLGSVHMVANVSRLLESTDIVKVSDSVVKPDHDGCTFIYREYRHDLDPFTWPKPFDPKKEDGWIGNDKWIDRQYWLHHIDELTNKHGNTHSIGHYLANPAVHQDIMEHVFEIRLTKAEKDLGYKTFHAKKTLGGKAKDLKEHLKKTKSLNLDNIVDLILVGKELKDFVEGLGGQYK